MKNIEPKEFLLDVSDLVEEGRTFMEGFPTMYDCYEALLRGEAGYHSFLWALRILGEDGISDQGMMRQFVELMEPLLPHEILIPDLANALWGTKEEFNNAHNLLLDSYGQQLQAEDSMESTTYIIALFGCLLAAEGDLVFVGNCCFTALLYAEYKNLGIVPSAYKWGEILLAGIKVDGGAALDKAGEKCLSVLRGFGNPFEASENDERNT